MEISIPQKLQHEDALLRAIFEDSAMGIVVINEEGFIVKINPFAAHMLGYALDELIGQQSEILVPDSFRSEYLKQLKSYFEKPKSCFIGDEGNLFVRRKDGENFPIDISLSYYHSEGNINVIAIINDIAKRKEKENELRTNERLLKESETKAQILFDHSAIMIWEEDFSGVKLRIDQLKEEGVEDFRSYFSSASEEVVRLAGLVEVIQVNQETLNFYNVQSKEELVTSLPEWFVDESWNIFEEELIALAEGASSFEGEIPVVSPSGEHKVLLVRLSVRPERMNDLSSVLVSFIDITELKKNEALLKEKEQQLLSYSNQLKEKVDIRTKELAESQAKLLEAQQVAGLGYVEYNLISGTINGSKQLFEIYELDSDDPISFEQYNSYVHPEDKEYLLKKMTHAQNNNELYVNEHRVITAKGNVRHIFTKTIRIIKNSLGEAIERRGIVQDITALKIMEHELKENQVKLESALMKERELGELKSRFVSMASHEFRTPLTTILSSSNLVELHLERGNFDRFPKHINNIRSAVKNLTSILGDFLSLEKLEAGKVQFDPEQVDLTDFVGIIIEELKLLAIDDQEIIYRHSGDQTAYIDQYLVRNILINLLSNAIKYSPDGGHIDLHVENGPSNLVIKVKDRGIGIPEGEQQEMFSRFFRASNVSTIQGTGIGLTIVKRYLDIMKGTIRFESQMDKGTTFIVEIPR